MSSSTASQSAATPTAPPSTASPARDGCERAAGSTPTPPPTKGHHTTLLTAESTGALAPSFRALLRILGRQAVAPGTQDSTVYGTARASPRTFFAHHHAAITSAIVNADATVILNAAAALSCSLTFGIHPTAIRLMHA